MPYACNLSDFLRGVVSFFQTLHHFFSRGPVGGGWGQVEAEVPFCQHWIYWSGIILCFWQWTIWQWLNSVSNPCSQKLFESNQNIHSPSPPKKSTGRFLDELYWWVTYFPRKCDRNICGDVFSSWCEIWICFNTLSH